MRGLYTTSVGNATIGVGCLEIGAFNATTITINYATLVAAPIGGTATP
jgi:hypothetical protein